MRWLKRDKWKVGIALAGLLLFLKLMVWVPMSASAYEGALGVAIAEPMQTTPTVDVTATITALNEEKLRQEIQQLKNQNGSQISWLVNNSTALIAAITAIIVAFIGFTQWTGNRRDERRKELVAQDKDLRAQAEERFQAAVAALGSEKESTQVGGAILLRSFLNEDDKEIYRRYYTQIFDLAVAYLRPSNTSLLTEDPDRIPFSSEDLPAPLPLTPLRQALIVVFREVFPLAREEETSLSQDATGIQLDHAYLVEADLKQLSVPYSSLRKADFAFALLQEVYLRGSHLERAQFVGAQLKEGNLTIAHLEGANFNGAHLEKANLGGAHLKGAYFQEAQLKGAIFGNADLTGAHLSGADLTDADLSKSSLEGASIEEVKSLKGADLREVKGLTAKQLLDCKFKGAVVDVATTVKALQKTVSPSPPAQSSDAQAPSAAPAQVDIPPPSTDGNSNTSSQPSAEP